MFHDDVFGELKTRYSELQSRGNGKLEKLSDRGFVMTEITLRPTLVIGNARDFERANQILEKAEKHCLISNSIRSETKLEPEIRVADRESVLRQM